MKDFIKTLWALQSAKSADVRRGFSSRMIERQSFAIAFKVYQRTTAASATNALILALARYALVSGTLAMVTGSKRTPMAKSAGNASCAAALNMRYFLP